MRWGESVGVEGLELEQLEKVRGEMGVAEHECVNEEVGIQKKVWKQWGTGWGEKERESLE